MAGLGAEKKRCDWRRLQACFFRCCNPYCSGQSVEKTTDWESSQPIEEYKAVYSNGQAGQDITVTVAQWSTSDYALKQYQSLTGQLKGTQIAQGNVSVNGAQTGSYIAREDQKNTRNAVVIEQNSSVLFQLSGPKAQMTDFFDKFGY